jgi:hypothetical protein
LAKLDPSDLYLILRAPVFYWVQTAEEHLKYTVCEENDRWQQFKGLSPCKMCMWLHFVCSDWICSLWSYYCWCTHFVLKATYAWLGCLHQKLPLLSITITYMNSFSF